MENTGFLTDPIKAKIMAAIFNAGNATPPAMPVPPITLYYGLTVAYPARDGTFQEIVGTNYARTAVASTSVNWTPNSTVTKESSAIKISLPVPGATWNTAVGWILIDSASGAGNVWFAGTFPSTTYTTTSTPYIAIGALQAQL